MAESELLAEAVSMGYAGDVANLNAIEDNGDGTYTVTYIDGTKVVVGTDGTPKS